MPSAAPNEKAIFNVARAIHSAEARSEYLHQVCGDNQDMVKRVQSLLEGLEKHESFLESPAASAPTIDRPSIALKPGTRIGPYKILQEIGEGGMGVVFMAEQSEPVKRRVALKVIKPGMDSRHVIARFEAERQALAMMDHHHIAKVFDAGTTDSGQPYFAMELVKGVPITQFCDDHRLTTRERLELVVSVCHAVQHAHQKGIIHRDLKPSNVMVALFDDKPMAKVIDFGVAKATHQQLTERTLFTQVGQIVGTWEYMSPEQAVLNQLDVDTRSDVYALGVILYELLTGVTPLDPEQLRAVGIEDTLRLIRDEEPARPSTRVTSLGESAAVTATQRRTDANSLTRLLRGDLDCIVMKALEKNRSRRYETANALADDVNRYLRGDPIEAKATSTVYRLRKAAARHRVMLTAASVVALTLVIATVTSIWFAVSASRSLRTAQVILFDKVLMIALSGDAELTEEALNVAAGVHLPPAWHSFAIAVAHTWNGDHELAREYYAEAKERGGDSFAIRASEMQVMSSDRDFYPRIRQLREIGPVEPLDYVFQAQIEAWYTPQRAINALDAAGEWKSSTLAQYFGAIARANQALIDQDLQEAEEAVQMFDHLLKWYPENKVPLCGILYTSLAARHIARRQKLEQVASEYEAVAEQAAEALANTDIFWVTRARAWYFAECGRGLDAIAEWKLRMRSEPLGIDPMHYAACTSLFGDESKRQEALEVLPDAFDARNAHAHLARGYLLALLKAPREEVENACQQLVNLNDPRREMQCGIVEIWLLYGDLDKARQEAARLVGRGSDEGDQYWDVFLQYLLHDDSDSAFIREFKGADAPMFVTKAEYLAGLKAYAEGDRGRERAKSHFRDCCETGRVFASWYWWSKVLLRRLDGLPATTATGTE